MDAPPLTERRLSFWLDTTPVTDFPRLDEDVRADVIVVGGGITGVTTAYLLAKAGKSVVLLDRQRIVTAETGHTTAHLQLVPDTRLATLVERFGLEGAKAHFDSQLEAVRAIESIVHEERIRCDLERLDAYLYGPRDEDVQTIRQELRVARRIGHEAHEASPDDVPFDAKAAIRFPHQGKFHPRKYLLAIAERAERLGARIFEGTPVKRIESGRPATAVTRDGARATGDWLVVATQAPISTRLRMWTRLYPFRSYVIGARVARGTIPDALYWDTLSPHHYTRVDAIEDGDLVILGGEDRTPGDPGNTEERYRALEEHLRRSVTGEFDVRYRWSAQDLDTEDGHPYIGHVPGAPANELVATGYSGTGMTNGTLAALMLTEHVLGRGTPWDDLYDPARVTTKAGPLKRWARENLHDLSHLARSPFARSEVESAADLAPGEGAIIRDGFGKLAVSRDRDGRIHAVHATCTHVGCTVRWNPTEESWDCPCHGSRFAPTGEVLTGPARDPLASADASRVEGRPAGAIGRRER